MGHRSRREDTAVGRLEKQQIDELADNLLRRRAHVSPAKEGLLQCCSVKKVVAVFLIFDYLLFVFAYNEMSFAVDQVGCSRESK